MKPVRFLLCVVLSALSVACRKDEPMHLPQVPADIVSMELEGQTELNVDKDHNRVDAVMQEGVDLSCVRILELKMTEGTSLLDERDYLDLSFPDTLHLMNTQEEKWVISAVQPVARYVNVEGQVGEAEIDVINRKALVSLSKSHDLSAVTFIDVKLEALGSQVVTTRAIVDGVPETEGTPVEFPMTLDCRHDRIFTVEYEGAEYEWTVSFVLFDSSAEVKSLDVWACHVDVLAQFDADGEPVLKIRQAGSQDWSDVGDIKVHGAEVSARISGLKPSASYEVMLVDGEQESDPVSFVTEAADQVPNMSFDEWHADGKVWYPYAQGLSYPGSAWASANPGSAAFIGSSTLPEETHVVAGKAVKMESKEAKVLFVSVFAAGNLFTGKFLEVDIMSQGATLDWGYPFTCRPTALKGHYSYSPAQISKAKEPYKSKIGETDKCQITAFLTDWDKPFLINTTTGQFVDMYADYIIASAKLESDEATDGYREFRLDFEYRDTERKPTYIVISACASYLGDYFTGGVGSTLYVDEFELIYE